MPTSAARSIPTRRCASACARLGSVIWVSVLYGLGIFVGLLLLIVPGIFVTVAWSVAIPVLLAENLRGRGRCGARARSCAVAGGRARA